GAMGEIASVVVTPTLVSSGASQAVMGLAGCAAIKLFRLRKDNRIRMIITLGVICIQVAIDLIAAHTIKAGHVVGFCVGAILGCIIKSRHKA
ncbi:MAG TPA: rhomboid family intramembrane serine protease, partial [Pyrinomonadaceae bacterium]|nr:rhomboid family intramembrane serine protease [Pyrinomonadaceae bacterium]